MSLWRHTLQDFAHLPPSAIQKSQGTFTALVSVGYKRQTNAMPNPVRIILTIQKVFSIVITMEASDGMSHNLQWLKEKVKSVKDQLGTALIR